MLTAFMASNFLSPNGYIGITADAYSLLPIEKQTLAKTNFLDLMFSRLAVQQSMNLAASRAYSATYEQMQLNLPDSVEEGVIYQNACVNTLMLGTLNTLYTRKRFPTADFTQWTPIDGVATLLKMWASGGNRPECGAYVGFRLEGKRKKVIFPEFY